MQIFHEVNINLGNTDFYLIIFCLWSEIPDMHSLQINWPMVSVSVPLTPRWLPQEAGWGEGSWAHGSPEVGKHSGLEGGAGTVCAPLQLIPLPVACA